MSQGRRNTPSNSAAQQPPPDWQKLESAVIEFMGGMMKWHRGWGKLPHDEQLLMVKAALPNETSSVRGHLAERLTSLHDGGRSEAAFKTHKTLDGHYGGRP